MACFTERMVMKTPLLIDVPKMAPTKRERWNAFKERHGIETHYCRGMEPDELPWVALHMPSARKIGYGITETSSIGECFAHAGELLDQAKITGYGKNERAAIMDLFWNLKIDPIF